jgi:hypothetical protein
VSCRESEINKFLREIPRKLLRDGTRPRKYPLWSSGGRGRGEGGLSIEFSSTVFAKDSAKRDNYGLLRIVRLTSATLCRNGAQSVGPRSIGLANRCEAIKRPN